MTTGEADLLKRLERALEQIERQEEMIRERDARIHFLEAKVDALIKRIFGASSEKIDPAQLELLLGGVEPGKAGSSDGADAPEEDAAANAKNRRKRRKRQQPRWPKDIKVEVEKVLIPDEVLANPGKFREISEEHTDYLDFTPGHFLLRRIIRKKYVSIEDADRPPLIASAPVPPIPGIRCAPGLAGHVLFGKYGLHQPLYRQQFEFMTRYEVYLPRQTLDHWVMRCAARLRILSEAVGFEVLAAYYIQLDDTPLFYLEPGHGRTRKGAMWVYNDPAPGGSVCYRWHTSRGHESPEEFVVDAETGELLFRGTLQGDCYSAHETLVRKYPELKLVACMAHMRRYFVEALDLGEKRYSPLVVLHIANLYVIETRLKEQKAGPALREARRKSESRPIMNRLHQILLIIQKHPLPESALGKAVNYALKHWTKLEAYLEDGRIEIDNNATENAIRPTKLGMRNWLFIGSAEAGWAAAVMYTLIENCKRQGLDPYRYLVDVLTLLPEGEPSVEEVAHLTPASMAEARRGGRKGSAA